MSLYNMLHGTNANAEILLTALHVDTDQFGRFRDAYLSDDGQEIHVFTRCGGGNREEYQHVFDEMLEHPHFSREKDDEFDCTYATFTFHTPEVFKEAFRALAEKSDTTTPEEKFTKLMDDLNSGASTPETVRAMELGKQILAATRSDATMIEIGEVGAGVTVEKLN